MDRFTIRSLGEDEFQGAFEACGDSDPLGLVNEEGEVVGLLLYNDALSGEQLIVDRYED